jgi:S-(hydroxymethyl)glutathione dehydrogenase/alcohol dehydrogenase
MKTVAAILVELGQPLEIGELEIQPLKPGQVLVEISYSGVCHTQLLEARGHRGKDNFLPHCLGHEGSGVVLEVGPGVSKVRAGDAVILSWIKGSGSDVPGTTYRWNGRVVNAGGLTTFSRHAVVSENRLTVISAEFDRRLAALVGCAVPTGAGVVINTLQPSPGQSLAVFGTGGVGLCAVAAAALAGCHPVIAIDRNPERLNLAQSLGATQIINVQEKDPVAEIRSAFPTGVDYAVEATGLPAVMDQALSVVRAQGGATAIVGNARFGARWELDPRQLNQGKRILGTWGGDNAPDRDFPRYCRLIAAGKLPVQHLLTREYSLSEINAALDDLEAGATPRPIINLAIDL